MMIELYDGKYCVQNDKGLLKIYRNGQSWKIKEEQMIGDSFVLALVQKIEDLQNEITKIKNDKCMKI